MNLIQDLQKVCPKLVPQGVMYSISPTTSFNRVNLVLTRIGTPKSVVCNIQLGRYKFEAGLSGSLEFHQSSSVSLPNGPYSKEQFLVMVIKLALHLLTGEYV